MNIIIFWDAALCNLVQSDKQIRDAYCLHDQGDQPGDRSESTIETWVSFYQITRYIAEYFFVSRRENMKSHLSSEDNIWRKKTK
jgi:hypothetical protein